MIEFRIPGKEYSLKIIDSLAFLQGSLSDLSKELDDDLKNNIKETFQR